MKILHVAQAVSRNFGGVQTVLHDLVKAEKKAGLNVDVLSTNVDTPKGVLPVARNCFIERDGVRIRHSSVSFRPLLFSVDLKNYLDQNVRKYDLVHVHGLYRFPTTYAAYQARKQNVPYIISPHGSLDPYLYDKSSRSVYLKRLYENWFDLPNLHNADGIHYTTEDERQRVAANIKIRAPSFVVPNGLDWSLYESLPARGALRARLALGDAPLILFLGRLHFKKGLDILIPAVDEVRKKTPAAQLLIVGPECDGYGKKVRQWVYDHQLQGAVHFVGALQHAEVLQAYVDSDVFVLPSYTENFGMTVVEAMACRLPVVISDQVNICEEVRTANAGLVTTCEADKVAAALLSLLRDPDECLRTGAAGRRLVRTRYTWTVIVDSLIREYKDIVERHKMGTTDSVMASQSERESF